MSQGDHGASAPSGRAVGASAPDHAVVLDCMGDAVITTDPQFGITSWNRAATEIYGWEADEVRGASVTEVLRTTWSREEDRQATIDALRTEGRWRGEVGQFTRDGRPLRVFSVVTLLRDADDQVLGVVAVNRDVTRERAAEAALRQVEARLTESQRTDALGRLAGSVAHDFNNLLAVVGGNTEIALGLLPHDHPARRALMRVASSVDRGATLARQLLSFGRRDELDVDVLDLAALVRGVDEVLRRLVGGNARLVLTLPGGPVWARVSRGEVELALVNLVHNARLAIADGGEVEVVVGVEPDGGGRIEVRDAGAGMPPEVRARAFEAFFTTRPPGQGTGLGLTVVARVASRHGGRVDLESDPGVGTRVRLRFPAAAAPVVEPTRPRPTGTPSLRVLVVDDQELVRDVLSHLVEALGHRPMVARSGAEALERARAEPFDLLLTDVYMPGMSGPALAAALRAERPDLPVVYVSGFPREGEGEEARGWPSGVFRTKPIRRDDLRTAIAEAMGGDRR